MHSIRHIIRYFLIFHTLLKLFSEAVKEVVKREGQLDYAFDCIGNQTVLNSALELLSPWGTLVAIGEALVS